MKTSKSLYSMAFEEYRLSDDTLERLQDTLLSMLLDVKAACDKHGVDYMLSGGTMLGAVRHHGFIPWDDDADLMMLREQYERFKAIFQEELADRYVLGEPLSGDRYVNKMAKIYKKGTTFVEIPKAGIGGLDMVYIDLFVIENVPPPGLRRKIKGLLYYAAHKASSACSDYRYPSPAIVEKGKTNPEIARYYAQRRRIGAVFSHLGGMRFYLKMCEKIARQKKYTGWLGIPSGIHYTREIFPARVFQELTSVEFCGHEFKAPAAYDEYLSNLYGDYMQLPPPEKRQYHVAYKIDLGSAKGED